MLEDLEHICLWNCLDLPASGVGEEQERVRERGERERERDRDRTWKQLSTSKLMGFSWIGSAA